MTLVNEDVVDAQLVKDQAVVFLLLGQEVFQTLLAPGFLLLERLDDVAVRARRLGGRAVTQELVVRGDLLPQKALLKIARHADALEGTVRGDDAVPGAAGHLGREELAPVPREILLGGDQQSGVGIQLLTLAGELLEHMIGHDIQGLADEPGLPHFHPGGHHDVGLARARPHGRGACCHCS